MKSCVFASGRVQRLGTGGPPARRLDLLDLVFGRGQQLVAMRLQLFTALIGADRGLKRNVAAFEIRDDALQRGARACSKLRRKCRLRFRGVAALA